MKNFKLNQAIICILCFSYLFIASNIFNKNNAQTGTEVNSLFFPNSQTVSGPGFFPFSNSQGVLDIFNEQCPNPTFLFDGPDSLSGSPFEVGPAANGFETGNRDVLVFDANGNLTFVSNNFPLVDPFTMNAFDPSMGDILGLSFVPGNNFPSGTEFMITTTFNCDGGSSTTSSSSSSTSSSSGSSASGSSGQIGTASSSGIVLTNPQIIGSAISSEKTAKNAIDLKDLLTMNSADFSVSMALDALMSSLSDLENLQSMLGDDASIMVAMSTVGSKISEIINSDNEVIMLLEPYKDSTPSISDSEFTQAVSRAKRLLDQALRVKAQIEKKLKKLEPKDK